MPVPFDDLSTERVQPEAIAWLRFVEEEDGKGIRAALFQTSIQGEPLGFCFTRVSRGEPSERTGAVRPNPRSYLAKSLFQAATSSPILVLGLADEVSRELFTKDIRPRVPFCRIGTAEASKRTGSEHGGPVSGRFGLFRSSEQPWGTSRRTLCEIMRRSDPLEPFERAAGTLAEAFCDERVQAMTAVSGLSTVVCLP